MFSDLKPDCQRELAYLGWGASSVDKGLLPLAEVMGIADALLEAPNLTVFFSKLGTAQASWFYYFLDSISRGRRLINYAADKIAPNARFLDVGCGYAGSLVAAHDYGMLAHGIEIDQRALAGARALLEERRISSHLSDCDVHTTAFDAFAPMDLIVCENVIEHVDDPRGFMERLFDKLAPGGALVMEIPNGFALRSVGCDPHYALPFLSLLPEASARRVFDEVLGKDVCGDGYSVGDYFPLTWYLDIFPPEVARWAISYRDDAISPQTDVAALVAAMEQTQLRIDKIYSRTTPLLREKLRELAQIYTEAARAEQPLDPIDIALTPDPESYATRYLAAAWIIRFDRIK